MTYVFTESLKIPFDWTWGHLFLQDSGRGQELESAGPATLDKDTPLKKQTLIAAEEGMKPRKETQHMILYPFPLCQHFVIHYVLCPVFLESNF